MIAKYVVAYVAAAITFAAIDFVWLSNMAASLYRPVLGDIMLEKPRMAPAVAFYVIYLAGIMVFAVSPALRTGQWQTALLYGAAFGFFAYATYDLTSHATLRVWALKITVLDILWGTVLTAISATAGYLATTLVGR